MIVGIVKEIKPFETRVALTPKEVRQICELGHEVNLQAGAGERAGFLDSDYLKVGAKICPSIETLYDQSKLIVKVKEPQEKEIGLIGPHHLLFCYLHLGGSATLTQSLAATGVTAYGFECLVKNGQTPLLAPMSHIAGRLAVQIGTWFLQATQGGRGTLLGGQKNQRSGVVTVVGAGVAGAAAIELAYGMGARVQVLDVNQHRLIALKTQFPEIQIDYSNAENLFNALMDTDILVGAVYSPGHTAPKVISEEMLKGLPKGAVAVDIAVDQGGCFAVTKPCSHGEPFFQFGEVKISAIPNLPAAVPRTGSINLAEVILPYVLELAEGKVSIELQTALNLKEGQLQISV